MLPFAKYLEMKKMIVFISLQKSSSTLQLLFVSCFLTLILTTVLDLHLALSVPLSVRLILNIRTELESNEGDVSPW